MVTVVLEGPMPINYYMNSGSTYTTVGLASGLLNLANLVTDGQEYIQGVNCIDTGSLAGLLRCAIVL